MKHNRPPLTGIFAVEVHGVGSEPVPGAASLGVRPTVRQNGAPVLEVYLLDFDADIYRRHVRVEFLAKLRDEERYADLAALTRQIALDVENVKAYFHGRAAESQRKARI
jgi:riboflavin kinase/FMN adenylyltransferase